MHHNKFRQNMQDKLKQRAPEKGVNHSRKAELISIGDIINV